MPNTSPLRVALALVAAAAGASADTLTLAANADTTIYAESPDNTNGAGGSMQVGPNSMGHARRALLRFRIAEALPAGAQIVSARLELHCSQSSGGAALVELHRLLESWGEGNVAAGGGGGQGAPAVLGDATWNERFFSFTTWTTPGATFDGAVHASTSVTGIGDFVLEGPAMAADVQLWLDQPTQGAGWILLGEEATVGTAKRLETRESSDLAARPRLVVTYEPGSARCSDGDGGSLQCPCANPGLPGHGCENAAGTGGVELRAQDFLPDGLGGGSVRFSASSFPPAQAPGVVLIRSNASATAPFEDGVLCLATPLVRLQGGNATSGAIEFDVQHGAGSGQFVYQLWYRSAPASFCTPAAANLSNGYALTW